MAFSRQVLMYSEQFWMIVTIDYSRVTVNDRAETLHVTVALLALPWQECVQKPSGRNYTFSNFPIDVRHWMKRLCAVQGILASILTSGSHWRRGSTREANCLVLKVFEDQFENCCEQLGYHATAEISVGHLVFHVLASA